MGLLEWYKRLCVEGELYGYIVDGSKSWRIVKSEKDAARAKEIFGDQVNITTEGQRHLGAALGSNSFKDTYCSKKVENWSLDESDESPDRDRQDSASVSIPWLHKRIRIQVHLLFKGNRRL